MGILKHIYPLFFLFFLTGCFDEFTPDVATKPVLCVNSLITAGEPIEVDVTHTWFYTDEAAVENHDVDDAVVAIYANGEVVNSDYIPKEGDRIRIVAESRRYGSAEAEVTVPVSVPIASLTWVAEVTNFYEWNDIDHSTYDFTMNLHAKLEFKDPKNICDYYQFSYKDFSEDPGTDEVTYLQPVSFTSGNFWSELEPIFSEHIGGLDSMVSATAYGFTFFTDRQFPGDSYTLNLKYENMHVYIGNGKPEVVPVDFGLDMSLSSVSESYYKWSLYLWNDDEGAIGDLSDIGLADPMWGYSNVSTGAGVVAAQSKSSAVINLRDFLYDYLSSELLK